MRARAPSLVRYGLIGAVGALAAWLVLGLLPPLHAAVGPGRLEVSTRPALSGTTTLEVPPVGQLSAHTHAAPLAIDARVVAVDFRSAGTQLASSTDAVGAWRRDANSGIGGLLVRLGLLLTAAGVAAGLVVGGLVPGRSLRTIVAGGTGALLTVGGILGLTAITFDSRALAHPRYAGPLSAVPALLHSPGTLLAGAAVTSRLQTLAAQIADAYTATGPAGPATAGEVTVLQVSDIHNNPVGITLTATLAANFHAAAVLDTGDLTSWGSPLEKNLVAGVSAVPATLHVPYLLVPGNHDVPAVRAQLATLRGVRMLDGQFATVGSGVNAVRILGVGDPVFISDASARAGRAAATLRDQAAGTVVRLRGESLAQRPALLAVHDPAQATGVAGLVTAVVSGHLHRRTWSVQRGTVFAGVGSTGAGGLGESKASSGAGRYEAQLLRFSRGRLVAVDYLVLHGSHGDFTVDRTLVGAAADEPVVAAAR